MIRTAEKDLEQYGTDDETNLPVNLDIFSYFYTHGYPVESIKELHTAFHVKPDAEDTAHDVLKIETLNKPLDIADAAVDTHTMWVCDCKAFSYHVSVDLEEQRITEWGHCKHIEAVDKSIRANADDSQETL